MPLDLLNQRIKTEALVLTLVMTAMVLQAANPATVVAWGNSYGPVPAGLTNAISIAAGGYHTLALKSDGTVAGWGLNGNGQATPPVGLSGVTAISAGGYHSILLKSDGSIVSMGYTGDENGYYAGQTTTPAGLNNFIAIAAGGYHSVGLVGSFFGSQGVVFAWGDTNSGQTRVGVSPHNEFVTAVAAGGYHSLALRNGLVNAWGDNSRGQLSCPLNLRMVSIGSGPVKAIAAGLNHSVALLDDGRVVAWGDNGYGQTNVPVGLTGVVAIAAGGYHTVALRSDGTVVAWGRNDYGQTTVPDGLSGVTAIAAGGFHTVAIGVMPVPPIITMQPQSQTVAAGNGVMFSVTASGFPSVTYQWLRNGSPIVGATVATLTLNNVQSGDAANYAVVVSNSGGSVTSSAAVLTVNLAPPTITTQPADRTVKQGGYVSFTVAASGTAPLSYQWRKVGSSIIGANSTTLSLTNVLLSDAGVYDVVVTNAVGSVTSSAAMLAVTPTTSGSVIAWGANYSGQTTVPAGLSGVRAIAAGGGHTVALRNDGTVVAWGWDDYGQTNVPASLSGVTAIAAGNSHTVALKNDGTVVAWGDNTYGQTTVPAGLSGVTAIAAGERHTVALKNDGTVVAWGDNFLGQTNVPAGLGSVMAVAAGSYHTVALKSDGTVVAWGRNTYGQTKVPAGLSGVTAIAAGNVHTVALKNDGKVVAWGGNSVGQRTVPYGLTGVAAIAAGGSHTVALKSDGTVVAWGFNYHGQTTVPAGLSGVTAIAAGGDYSVALVVAPAIASQPQSAVSLGGMNATFGVTASYATGYQWLLNNLALSGQTNATLNLGGLRRTNGGNYSVIVTGAGGSVTSSPALLRVRVPHRLLPPVQTNGVLRLLSTDQDGGLLSTNDLPYFVVQSGTNLASTNWVSFSYTNGLLLTNGMLRLDDTNAATRPVRFYRVLEQ